MNVDYTDVPGLTAAVHNAIVVADAAQQQLEYLARCFETTGNSVVADKLYTIAESLHKPPRLVQLAHSRDVQGQIAHGEAMIGGMLTLALQGKIGGAP